MSDRAPNNEARTDEDGPIVRPLDVDTSTTPRPDDLPASDLPPDVGSGNPFDPDEHGRRTDGDPRSGQVGPKNSGNTGLADPNTRTS